LATQLMSRVRQSFAVELPLRALFLGAIGAVVLSSRGIYEQGLSNASLEGRARRTVQRVASEMTSAVSSTVVTTATSIQFNTCTGFAGGVQQWSTLTRIDLRPEPRDPDDGVDNDNDGFVDEHQIVLVRNVGGADEIEAVLCGGVRRLLQGEIANLVDDNGNGLVDERGLSFVVDANRTIRIRLTLEARDPNGLIMARTVETSVHMRN
jgi:hypothetical protein